MVRKKVCALMLAGVIAVPVFATAGCSGSNIGDTEQSLEVYVWEAGYGSQWMWEMLEDFSKQDWVKEKYPELEYDVVSNDQQTYATDRINAGRANTIDLFVSAGVSALWESGNLLDLTECVFNQKVPGEDVLFKDKMPASILKSLEAPKLSGDTQYFAVAGPTSMGGLVYNVTLFEELGLEKPRTTEELFALCDKVYDLGGKSEHYKKTFTFTSSKVSYLGYMFPVWWAQYEGVDQYDNYYSGVYYDAVNNRTFANDVRTVSQTGRLKSLEVLETIWKGINGKEYMNKASANDEFIQGQTKLFLQEGLIMGCGDWFSTEMRERAADYYELGYTDTMGFMNAPVLSAIVDKCPSITSANAQKIGLASADALLSAVVDAVDKGDNTPTGDLATAGVTQKDFDTVKSARGVVYSIAANECTVIPSYTNAKELATDFLLYMATDSANNIYARNNYGAQRVFNYKLKEKDPELDASLSRDYGNTYRIQQDRAAIWENENTYILPYWMNYPLFVYGGLKPINGSYESYEAAFIDSARTVTAKDVFDSNVTYWTQDNNYRWNTALKNAGLN